MTKTPLLAPGTTARTDTGPTSTTTTINYNNKRQLLFDCSWVWHLPHTQSPLTAVQHSCLSIYWIHPHVEASLHFPAFPHSWRLFSLSKMSPIITIFWSWSLIPDSSRTAWPRLPPRNPNPKKSSPLCLASCGPIQLVWLSKNSPGCR